MIDRTRQDHWRDVIHEITHDVLPLVGDSVKGVRERATMQVQIADRIIALLAGREDQRAIARIVNVAHEIAWSAGVGGRETAGAIVSYLATSPDEITPFMSGELSPLDFEGDWIRGGFLSWHSVSGEIIHPEDLQPAEKPCDG